MTAQQHPAWCNPEECRVDLTPPGRHLSRGTWVRTIVLDYEVYLAATAGGHVSVEVDAFDPFEPDEDERYAFGMVLRPADAEELGRIIIEHGKRAQL